MQALCQTGDLPEHFHCQDEQHFGRAEGHVAAQLELLEQLPG